MRGPRVHLGKDGRRTTNPASDRWSRLTSSLGRPGTSATAGDRCGAPPAGAPGRRVGGSRGPWGMRPKSRVRVGGDLAPARGVPPQDPARRHADRPRAGPRPGRAIPRQGLGRARAPCAPAGAGASLGREADRGARRRARAGPGGAQGASMGPDARASAALSPFVGPPFYVPHDEFRQLAADLRRRGVLYRANSEGERMMVSVDERDEKRGPRPSDDE